MGVSTMVQLQVTNADAIEQLGGTSVQAGGDVVGVSVELVEGWRWWVALRFTHPAPLQ
jgi:hypothetical protein